MTAFKSILSELRLYVCNHIVASIPSNIVRMAFYRHIMGFELGEGVSIHLGVQFNCARNLKMGKNSVINENCRLNPGGGIVIGSNVAISAETIILTTDHDLDKPGFIGRSRPVTISDYAWIGTRALILPGVEIGEGAVVGAGSVVSKKIDPYCIAAGVPAKFIRQRIRNTSYCTAYRRFFH
jgi:acetyltransferase-like isoleucine patch superfamily enzyme